MNNSTHAYEQAVNNLAVSSQANGPCHGCNCSKRYASYPDITRSSHPGDAYLYVNDISVSDSGSSLVGDLAPDGLEFYPRDSSAFPPPSDNSLPPNAGQTGLNDYAQDSTDDQSLGATMDCDSTVMRLQYQYPSQTSTKRPVPSIPGAEFLYFNPLEYDVNGQKLRVPRKATELRYAGSGSAFVDESTQLPAYVFVYPYIARDYGRSLSRSKRAAGCC